MNLYIRLHLFKFTRNDPEFGQVDVSAWKTKHNGIGLLADNLRMHWLAGSPDLADTFNPEGPFTAITIE